jgi:hypothetical protein
MNDFPDRWDPVVASTISYLCALNFCEMDAIGDKQASAADAKMQGFMKQRGTDFQTAWVASDVFEADTPDGKGLNTALDNLTGKYT